MAPFMNLSAIVRHPTQDPRALIMAITTSFCDSVPGTRMLPFAHHGRALTAVYTGSEHPKRLYRPKTTYTEEAVINTQHFLKPWIVQSDIQYHEKL